MSDWSAVSVVMITRNAAATLAAALRSIPPGAEVIVADGNSSDQTVSIAASFGARVISQDHSLVQAASGNFDVARNQAIEMVGRQWLFILDSDEQVTERLAAEVADVIRKKEAQAAYDLPRQNLFWGKQVRLLGEDRQIRLLRSGCGYYRGNSLHRPISIDGTIGRLEGRLVHHNIRSFSDVIRRFRRYIPIERQGTTSVDSRLEALHHTWRMGRYYLVDQQAWRDGWRGILTSVIYSIYHGLTVWPGEK